MQPGLTFVVAFTLSLVTAPLLCGRDEQPGEGEAKKLLQSIVDNKFQPPVGRRPAEFLPTLSRSLASPDPKLRDDLAFTILSDWIYDKALLDPEELRPLIAELLSNLRVGLEEEGSDKVLLRSFSALTLSVIAARDNKQPFLRAEEFRQLLDGALSYFAAERDTRGFDETKGWIHTVAHTSDLLKFLARSRYLAAADQARILDALSKKIEAVSNIFGEGEDERMARVVISLLHRPDLDLSGVRSWLTATSKDAKFRTQPTRATLHVMQNTRHLLTSLLAEMSVDKRPFTNSDEVSTALKDALAELM